MLKTEINLGIVDSSNHHGISRDYTAENYIRAWEKKLKDLKDAIPIPEHASCHYFSDEWKVERLESFPETRVNRIS